MIADDDHTELVRQKEEYSRLLGITWEILKALKRSGTPCPQGLQGSAQVWERLARQNEWPDVRDVVKELRDYAGLEEWPEGDR